MLLRRQIAIALFSFAVTCLGLYTTANWPPGRGGGADASTRLA